MTVDLWWVFLSEENALLKLDCLILLKAFWVKSAANSLWLLPCVVINEAL